MIFMDSGLLGCDAASPGKWFPTFRRNVMPSKRRDLPIRGGELRNLKPDRCENVIFHTCMLSMIGGGVVQSVM